MAKRAAFTAPVGHGKAGTWAKIGQEIDVPLEQLAIPFFVRKKLDNDWVLTIAEAIEGGVAIPPITVYPNEAGNGYDTNDGRHRMEAARLCDKATIRVKVVTPPASIVEQISQAFRANCGGPLPPTREDIEHTTSLLLAQGVKASEITRLLPIPPSIARKYVNLVYSRQLRARMKQAMEAVTEEDLSIPKAAEKYNVEPDTLRKAMGGRKKASTLRLAEVVATVRRRARSYSQTNSSQVRKLLESFEDGDVPFRVVEETLKVMRQSVKQMAHTVDGWTARAEAAKVQQAKLAKAKREE